MMTHEVFSIVAPVSRDPDLARRLRSLLEEIAAAPAGNLLLPFGKLPMVHFASFVVFSNAVQAPEPPPAVLPDQLVFESCIDGPFDEYVAALLHVGRAALHDIFSCCANYTAPTASHDTLKAYLEKSRRTPHLLHIGNPGLRVDHIKSGATLRRSLDTELDEVVKRGRALDRPRDLMRALRARLNAPPSTRHHWFLGEPSDTQKEKGRYGWFADQQSRLASRVWHWSRLIVPGLLAAVLVALGLSWLWHHGGARTVAVAVVTLAVAWLLFWRWLKRGNTLRPPTARQERDIRDIKELEDKGVQNKMASLVILKAGWFRLLVIRIVLGLFNLIYRTVFTDLTPGRLLGLHTIHFGHWTILDLETEPDPNSGQRTGKKLKALMFLSNYDGSWETYLDDFLANLFNGVVAIWGHGVEFPSPLDGPIFKSWARTRMAVWHAWYQAYPNLTVANIENNDRIRQGLIDLPGSDHAARLWLSRFGSFKAGDEEITAARGALETHDVQGVVLSGYAHLPHAKYVLLRIEHPEHVRRWLAGLAAQITDARPLPRGSVPATNVALTHSGLTALGLDPGVLSRFPLAFQEGIAPRDLHHRSRVLGDVGENDPQYWKWGGGREDGKRVDLLLMVYATKDALDGALKNRVGDLCTSGAATLVELLDGTLFADGTNDAGRPLFREHFGFADGISQPEIEGTHRAASRVADRGSRHLVKPGEFLLGYAAGDGSIAPGVPLEAHLDRHRLLPRDESGRDDLREFGRNGSFLVLRQLRQDVAAFHSFVEHAAGAAASPQDAEEFAARLVGRRRDGTPLIASRGGSEPNEFGFSGDPHGFACPVGAHIRRANPRDSLAADPAAALKSANRHRLLRRGRPYVTPAGADPARHPEERGMLFICLNGDIERQFEFVQQNWINNTEFSGLAAERDGLVGAPSNGSGSLTVQSPTVRERTLSIPSFVTVKGGEYFFLPGLSALRYLATLADGDVHALSKPALVLQPPLPPFVGRQPSRLRRALAAVEGLLPMLRLAWAARYPLLVALVLVFWPLVAARRATYLGSHFLVGWWGLVAVSLLASLAAFVVMIALRIVLLYGWRSRPGGPRWTASARWFQVLGFQALSLPIVLAAIRYSALDGAGIDNRSYWHIVIVNLGAAGIGWLTAIVLLTVASSLQALRPGSRPDLFFPPNPLAKRLADSGAFRARLRRPSEWLSRLSRWIVSSVPEELGVGYIDYRRQSILPGHAFAASVALILFVVYAAGYLTLNPAWTAPWTQWGHEIPALAYLILLLIVLGSLLSMLAFFFDRYGIPTLVPLALWLAIVASVGRTDHYFAVQGEVDPARLPPAEVVLRADRHHPQPKVIVIAAEGLGLTSSAWTAEVLATLAEKAGGRVFTDSLRLVSASSGASLGTMYFVEAYDQVGFPTAGAGGAVIDPGILERIRTAAWQPSDSENAWGVVYPDLARTFAPLFVPAVVDRGWAMEQAWTRQLRKPTATLNGWRSDVADGWRPATAFGVTVVETGGRHLLATYDANACTRPEAKCPDKVTHGRDMPMVTAARLATTFPYVSPVARAQVDGPAYHLTDGGFWDNYGVVTAIEWIKQAAPALRGRDVMLIEIRSSAAGQPPEPEERAWTFGAIGPLLAMLQVRTNAQRVRNDFELTLLDDQRSASNLPRVAHAIFNLGDPDAKLSWRLGRRDLQRMKDAWQRDDNRVSLEAVRAFLGVQ